VAEFVYKALDKEGKIKKGSVIGDTIEMASDKLRGEHLTILEINPATALNKEININIGAKIKPRDLSVFCRQIVSMLDAGVTIIEALGMLEDQTENKVLAKAMGGVKAEIGKGETLSNALAKFPDVFPEVMVQMVAAGEASGKLDVAFSRMAVHFEKSAKMQGIVKKTAMYPIMVGIVALAVVVIMLVKVIPGYQDMFDQMGTELPGITKAVVAASNFLLKFWYIIVIIIVAVVFGISFYSKTPDGQVVFAKIARNMPIFGKLTIKSAASNFARMMSTLIYSGLPMVDALAITAGTMTNYLYRKKLEDAREEVKKGIPLSEPLLNDDLFPSMVGHMTRIGEETGQIEEMLTKLADYYDEEVEMATQTAMAALEPVIILLLAAVVGVLIAAVMAPMLAMYQNMDNL
jgi:type IV pilus assembly protein PilC